jgi:hypothetical protein
MPNAVYKPHEKLSSTYLKLEKISSRFAQMADITFLGFLVKQSLRRWAVLLRKCVERGKQNNEVVDVKWQGFEDGGNFVSICADGRHHGWNVFGQSQREQCS